MLSLCSVIAQFMFSLKIIYTKAYLQVLILFLSQLKLADNVNDCILWTENEDINNRDIAMLYLYIDYILMIFSRIK